MLRVSKQVFLSLTSRRALQASRTLLALVQRGTLGLFFLFLSLSGAHATFQIPSGFQTSYGSNCQNLQFPDSTLEEAAAGLIACINEKEIAPTHIAYFCGVATATSVSWEGWLIGSSTPPCATGGTGILVFNVLPGTCPVHSATSKGQCTCDAAFSEANGTCGGGKLNGRGTLDLCPLIICRNFILLKLPEMGELTPLNTGHKLM